jgi:hypothetical protein
VQAERKAKLCVYGGPYRQLLNVLVMKVILEAAVVPVAGLRSAVCESLFRYVCCILLSVSCPLLNMNDSALKRTVSVLNGMSHLSYGPFRKLVDSIAQIVRIRQIFRTHLWYFPLNID